MTDCTSCWRSCAVSASRSCAEALCSCSSTWRRRSASRDALVVEQRAQLVDHELVHLLAHVLERLLRWLPPGARSWRSRPPAVGCWGPGSWLHRAAVYLRAAAGRRLRLLRSGFWSSARRSLALAASSAVRAGRTGPSSDSAMRSSARDTGDLGSCVTTGTPALTEIGTARSSGIGKLRAEAEHPLDLLDVELDLARCAWLSTSRSFDPATR